MKYITFTLRDILYRFCEVVPIRSDITQAFEALELDCHKGRWY